MCTQKRLKKKKLLVKLRKTGQNRKFRIKTTTTDMGIFQSIRQWYEQIMQRFLKIF